MFMKIIHLFLYTQIIKNISAGYLEAKSNYQKLKQGRNNIVNKAVWYRNNFHGGKVDTNQASLFRGNSLDVEIGALNNYDLYQTKYVQGSPFSNEFEERQKRSINASPHKHRKNSITHKKNADKPNDRSDIDSDKTSLNNALTMTEDYPYVTYQNNNENLQDYDTLINNNSLLKFMRKPIEESNDTVKNVTQKRSMQYDFETEVIKQFEYNEESNKTDDSREVIGETKDIHRNVFDKSNSEWQQNAPLPDINVYRVVPKETQAPKSKAVTEKGLIKVISMLTKSFRKVMKEHAEITDIHAKINEINDEFTKTVAIVSSKFQDFDLKYIYLVKLQEKLKEYNSKMEAKDKFLKNKEKEISKDLLEFENQQKKFLLQQKQFYNMQKLILAQNEKINTKQTIIAKTQNEISQKQNNFARILKKAKQLFADRQTSSTKEQIYEMPKSQETSKPYIDSIPIQTSTQSSDIATDQIKINLFSVPTYNRLREDPDELILREKDDQPIDELIYKYYFNNTFIDSVMQKHILNNFMNNKHTDVPQVKNKRDDLDKTILLPMLADLESDAFDNNNRVRRWINHSKHNKRKNRGKLSLATITNNADEKHSDKNKSVETPLVKPRRYYVDNHLKNDPFLAMALDFCNEIGQNLTHQNLSWCIEKTLRRLQFLEPKHQSSSPTVMAPVTTKRPDFKPKTDFKNKKPRPFFTKVKKNNPINVNKIQSRTTRKKVSTTSTTAKPFISSKPPNKLTTSTTLGTTKRAYTSAPIRKDIKKDFSFPDNDALEYNLRQFLSESPPDDNEGNIYFEGSAHESDIVEQRENRLGRISNIFQAYKREVV